MHLATLVWGVGTPDRLRCFSGRRGIRLTEYSNTPLKIIRLMILADKRDPVRCIRWKSFVAPLFKGCTVFFCFHLLLFLGIFTFDH